MPKDLAKNVVPPQIPGPAGPAGPQGPPGEGFSSSDIGVGPQGEQGPKGDTGFIEDIANDANDRVITAVGDGTVNAESNLTFDGSILTVTGLTVSADVTINDLTVGKGGGDVAFNTAVGYQVLNANTTGNYNVASGTSALFYNTEGSGNVASGFQALFYNTEGHSNTAVGFQTLFSNTEGNNNVASGRQALYFNTEGDYNVASGYQALYLNTEGDNNSASGYMALYSNTEGNYNVASGYQALWSNTIGDNNSALGYKAGYSGTTGSNNTYIGYNAQPSSAAVSNEIVLGDTNVTAVRTDGTIYVAGLDIDGTTVTSTAAELNIIDGDTTATATTLADADRVVVNDDGTMKQVALTDFETYFETALDTLGNVTSLGTLTALTVDNIAIDGTTIGHTGDTDLLSLASGELTVNGNIVIPDDGWIGGGSSQDRIIFDTDGNDITMETEKVIFYEYLEHYGDTNTYIRFQPDQISLRAGGTDYIDITSSGTNFSDTEVVRPKLKDYAETVKAHGNKSTTFNLDYEEGNVHTATITGGTPTIGITNPPATGIAGALTLILEDGAAGTITWDSDIVWPGGVAPALTPSGVDIVSFLTVDAGSTIYGFVGGINFG